MSAWFAEVQQKFIADFIEKDRWTYITDGLKITIIVTLLALIVGLILGILIAMVRCTHDQTRPKWFRSPGNFLLKLADAICRLYITVIRGTPTLVQLLIINFVILVSAQKITVAVITFGINSGAYVAELVRSGIAAVDPGQMEAGRSLGLSRLQSAWHIVLPQAMKNILPAIGNEMIALLKETAVAGYVAVQDLTRAGNLIRNNTYDSFNPLMLVAVVYLVLVISMTQLLGLLERRLRRSDKR